MRWLICFLIAAVPCAALSESTICDSRINFIEATDSEVESIRWSLDRAHGYLTERKDLGGCTDFKLQVNRTIKIATSPKSVSEAIEAVRTQRLEDVIGVNCTRTVFVMKYKESYWFTAANRNQQNRETPSAISGVVILPDSLTLSCWSNW